MMHPWTPEHEQVMRLSELAGRLWMVGSFDAAVAVCRHAMDVHPDASVQWAWADQMRSYQAMVVRGSWG
jgi:hypothetical protein